MKYTVCNDCPCMSVDYESGSSCNLGYDTRYLHLEFEETTSSGIVVVNREWIEVCENCGLTSIRYGDQEIVPKVIEATEIVDPPSNPNSIANIYAEWLRDAYSGYVKSVIAGGHR